MPMPDEVAVEREARFDVAPETLWNTITDPDLLAEWFGPAELELRAGRPDHPPRARPRRHRGP